MVFGRGLLRKLVRTLGGKNRTIGLLDELDGFESALIALEPAN